LRVETRERIADVDREEWNALVAASAAYIFHTTDFLRAYEDFPLQAGIEPLYFTFRDGAGRAVAVLPAYLQPAMDLLGVLAKADPAVAAGGQRGLLTHVWHCYETHLPGTLSPPVVAAACTALADAARRRGADWYGFINVDARGELLPHLEALGFSSVHIWDRFFLPLAGWRTVDEYVSSLPRSARHEMRRQVRRAEDAGAVITLLEPPFDAAELTEITALCRGTTRKFGSIPYYPEATFAPFLNRVGPNVRILTVRLDGALLGGWICFVDGRCFHTWAAGADYEAANFSPYYVGFHAAVRFAFENGMEILEGGRGNAGFKERHGMRLVPLYALLGKP
jgi:predicted N-acyltransferase